MSDGINDGDANRSDYIPDSPELSKKDLKRLTKFDKELRSLLKEELSWRGKAEKAASYYKKKAAKCHKRWVSVYERKEKFLSKIGY